MDLVVACDARAVGTVRQQRLLDARGIAAIDRHAAADHDHAKLPGALGKKILLRPCSVPLAQRIAIRSVAAHETEVLRQQREARARTSGLFEQRRGLREIGGHVVDRDHLDRRNAERICRVSPARRFAPLLRMGASGAHCVTVGAVEAAAVRLPTRSTTGSAQPPDTA